FQASYQCVVYQSTIRSGRNPMKNHRPVLKAILCFIALSTALMSGPAKTFAQDSLDYAAEFKRAAELIQANNMVEALPLLEKLHTAKPDDAVVLELLAYAISANAVIEKDAGKRKKDYLRARSLAERAKELGRNTQLVQLLLEQISPEGVWG